MNEFGFCKMLAVLPVAFACICMWGCSENEFHWDESRSNARVIGFVNDSLVMVGDSRCWYETWDPWFASYQEESGCGRERLCVYNYRIQENGPRWCDSLSNNEMTGVFGGQLTDSIVWGGDVSTSIRLWKIGEKPHEIELKKSTVGCSVEFRISSLKQWLDGTFIGKSGESLTAGGDSCQYAVLDTMARTLTFKLLEKDYEWLKECDDVRAWGGDVHCLYYNAQSANVYLKIENKVKDSIWVENQGWYSGAFFEGDLMLVDGNLCEYKDVWVCYPRQGVLKMGFHVNNGIILQF